MKLRISLSSHPQKKKRHVNYILFIWLYLFFSLLLATFFPPREREALRPRTEPEEMAEIINRFIFPSPALAAKSPPHPSIPSLPQAGGQPEKSTSSFSTGSSLSPVTTSLAGTDGSSLSVNNSASPSSYFSSSSISSSNHPAPVAITKKTEKNANDKSKTRAGDDAQNLVNSALNNNNFNTNRNNSSLSEAHLQISRRVQAMLNQPRLRRTQFSISIRWAESGESIFEHHSHLPLIPASNMKLVTTMAALNLLSPEFEYVTSVGICSDSLFVIGSGDPLLGDEETEKSYGRQPHWILHDIASRLKSKGITSINHILIDTSVFDQERVHPDWPKNALLQKYACEVSGLNYNGNCIHISVANRQRKTVLFLEPKTNYLRLVNATSAVASSENWFAVQRTSAPCVLRVTGKISSQAGPYAVAVENPAMFFGTLLKECLTRNGIKVEGEVKEEMVSTNQDTEIIATYHTPIVDVLRRANKDSLGLAAEALIKTLGAWENPDRKGGSWEGGSRAITNFLGRLGIPETEFIISDGSGLSRENRLSSHAVASLLLWIYHQASWSDFKATMAVGGVDGTLENVFREKNLKGRVIAKTGYINGVRALSGVTHTRHGDIIFSLLANHASNLARNIINNIIKEVTQWADALASPFSERN